MKSLALLCLTVAICALSTHTHAQVAGCAPGDISWSGGGVSTCLPGNTPPPEPSPTIQPLPPNWESRWGAIVTDEPHGIVGASSEKLNASAAEASAVEDCKSKGGTDCTVRVSFSNGCGVLLVGDKTFNVNWGDSESTAIKKGMAVCTANDTGCHVYFKTCSPPVRTR